MRRAFPHLALLLTFATPIVAADLPPETAKRLAAAFDSLESPAVTGYTTTVRVTVAKPNGNDREDHLEVVRTSRAPDGTLREELVRSLENGNDVTEARRAEQAKREAREGEQRRERSAGKEEKEEGSINASLRLPLGDDRRLFSFAPVAGNAAVVAFAPLPAHARTEGIARGTLAWDPATLDPLWLEAEPVVMPDHVSAMKLRFEFARAGDVVYPRRTVTDGTGGFLWIKRTFHMDLEVADLVATPAAPAP